MADVPRALLRALVEHRLSPATRLCLCVVWTWATAAAAEQARQSGTSLVVRVSRRQIAEVTGELERSVRKHLQQLETIGAISREGDAIRLTAHVRDLHPRPSETGEEQPDRGPARPGEEQPDRGGGTAGPDPRSEQTGGGEQPDRPPRSSETPIAQREPRKAKPRENYAPSSSSPAASAAPPRAYRPVELPARAPDGLDACAILTALFEEPHPDGAVRLRPTPTNTRELAILLAGDLEYPGEDPAEVLRVSRAYLRIVRERRPLPRRGGPAAPEDPRWWAPAMWRPSRWSVIRSIVAQVEAEERGEAERRRESERVSRERAEADRRDRVVRVLAATEEAVRLPHSNVPAVAEAQARVKADGVAALTKIRALREAAGGRELTVEEMEEALGLGTGA